MKSGEIKKVSRKGINSRVSEATITEQSYDGGLSVAVEITGTVDGLSFYAYMSGLNARTRWNIDKDYNYTSAQKSAIRRACDTLNEEA